MRGSRLLIQIRATNAIRVIRPRFRGGRSAIRNLERYLHGLRCKHNNKFIILSSLARHQSKQRNWNRNYEHGLLLLHEDCLRKRNCGLQWHYDLHYHQSVLQRDTN